MILYHYTTIDAFAKIWVSKHLRFSESKNTNDLFEKRKTWEFVSGILPTEKDSTLIEAFNLFGKAFSDVLAQYKQISFTTDYKKTNGNKSSMMWGQYAHNENGVCIEFDSDKLPKLKSTFRSKIKYTYNVPVIKFDKEEFLDEAYLQRFVKKYRKELFFTKHKHWEHENEYRIISNTMDFLPIEGAITKIYVYDPNNINTTVVERIVNDEVPIYYLYISHFCGDKSIRFDNLKSLREYEKIIEDEPDYYTNKEKVRKRWKAIADKFGLSIETEK